MNSASLKNLMRKIFMRNFHLKLITLILTLALYIWVSEDRETVVVGYAPIRTIVPPTMVLTSEPLDRVRVTIRGRWSAITRIDPTQLDPVIINLPQTARDVVIPITADMINLPPGLRIVSIDPNHMQAQLEPRHERLVTIVPNIVGQPRPSHSIGEVQVRPEQITISGPQAVLERFQTIPTEAVDISGRTQSFEMQVRLRPESRFIEYDTNIDITVSVSIITEEITRTFENITVEAVNTSYLTEVIPRYTNVTVRGPKGIVESIDRTMLLASVDLSEADSRPPGTYQQEVVIRNLPTEVTLVRVYPNTFQVTTLPRD